MTDWACACTAINSGSARICEYCGADRPPFRPAEPVRLSVPVVPTDRAFAAACIAHMKRIVIGSGPRGGWAPGEHVAWIREMARRFPAYYPEGPEPECEAWERYEKERDAKDAEWAAKLAEERRAIPRFHA